MWESEMNHTFNFRSYTISQQIALTALYEKPYAIEGWKLYEIYLLNLLSTYMPDFDEKKYIEEKKKLGRVENVVKKYRTMEHPILSYDGFLGMLENFEKKHKVIASRIEKLGKKPSTLYFLTPTGEAKLRKVLSDKAK